MKRTRVLNAGIVLFLTVMRANVSAETLKAMNARDIQMKGAEKMAKYIDADKLKKEMDELLRTQWENNMDFAPTNLIVAEAFWIVKDVYIDHAPAADVEPRKYDGEYIRKDDAIEAARHAWAKGLEPSQYIEILPTADVEPVRHGEWIKLDAHSGMEQYKCSACNSAVYVPECMGVPSYNNCPHCGAKMNGGSE